VGSPITGPAGNHEYLLWLSGSGDPSVTREVIEGEVTATLNR
jgi:23S rRNA (cytidine1920-2'-O)/16S rRNA (cytidine1409-2'-O)-methyltransferase